MTITEKARQLALDNGYTVSLANTIIDPGKFAGEHVSTLYYYDAMQNGGGDIESEDEAETIFKLDAEESAEMRGNYFVLTEDTNGFVYGDVMDTI